MLKRRLKSVCAVGGMAALTLAIFAAPPAQAAPKLESTANPPEVLKLKTCRSVEDHDARLQCYDDAIDAFNKAEGAGQIVVVDSARITEVRRQTFGFSFPSINLFARGIKTTAVDNVTLSLTGAQSDSNGRWIMTTTQGATWRLTETMQYGDPPHAGSLLQVRRGALGSFFCKIDSAPSVRCHRDQ